MSDKKASYIPPILHVVSVRVEQGFIGSGGGLDMVFFMLLFNDSQDDNNRAATYTTEEWNW